MATKKTANRPKHYKKSEAQKAKEALRREQKELEKKLKANSKKQYPKTPKGYKEPTINKPKVKKVCKKETADVVCNLKAPRRKQNKIDKLDIVVLILLGIMLVALLIRTISA